METKAATTEPPAKRRKGRGKSNQLELADSDVKVIPGLEHVPDCTLSDSADWCPATYGTLLRDPSTHDVTFKTSDGGSVSAHRVIMAAGSPVFHAMLYGNMKESSQKEIELPSVDTETFSMFVKFLYTGTVTIKAKCIKKLLDAAHYFNVTSLEDKLIDFVTKSLNVANIIDVITFARSSKFPQLFENCLLFMYDNATTVACGESFKCLPSDIVLTFCKCIPTET